MIRAVIAVCMHMACFPIVDEGDGYKTHDQCSARVHQLMAGAKGRAEQVWGIDVSKAEVTGACVPDEDDVVYRPPPAVGRG